MSPLSAVAVAVSFIVLALNWLGSITASAHALGWIFLIAAIVVLLDAFWVRSGARWDAWRNQPPPA